MTLTASTPRVLPLPSADLIARYSRPGPRYTSYPAVPYWSGDFSESDHRAALSGAGQRLRDGRSRAASLYVHIPFCERRCTFCACNVIISRDHSRGRGYLDLLEREMDLAISAMGGASPSICQLHWGGGTPTWLGAGELAALHDAIAARFELMPDREQSIEVDPRVTTRDQLAALRERGLNRVSMGVQDVDPAVQQAIGRVQPLETTARLIDDARELGIGGINVDLVYGLPHQSTAGFARSIEAILELRVDRIALYNFAWLPDRLAHHSAICPEWLPDPATRVELFRTAASAFAEAGYEMIGLDHFARTTDELAASLRDGTMQRNFMGYTTRAGSDLLGFGVSSISRVGRHFAQNVKSSQHYREALEAGRLPTERGMTLSEDDLLRESIIQGLMCYGTVDFQEISDVRGAELVADPAARRRLDELQADELIRWSAQRLQVTPLGRFFLRNIAMVFDAYLGRPPAGAPAAPAITQLRFSRTA